ncbi:sre-2/carboxylate carrier-like protein [Strigomonas culicis]|uniref:Sre-2/carboxylate carrier-like protein n=1 Tax=Strigomonas culicis TaxID=28005 RepID=S9UY18_9TRYP|nr:sre-2/carboxylate carrier-like protein [Strigomonas culicis]|eukprot:EPY33738.1 sre-2/carboxylate carrier-like protein [Strigomonas culicis]
MPTYPADTLLKDVQRFPDDLEYDKNSFMSRFQHYMSMTDPRTLLMTPAQLEDSKRIVAATNPHDKATFDKSSLGRITVGAYHEAQKNVRSTVHADSGENIFLPFRFSTFVPVNLVILAAMLSPSQQTPLLGMVWQFVNQTYNVGFNYCNASGKEGLPMQELLTGYAAASVTACGLSYVLSTAASKQRNKLLKILVPWVAVASAGAANVSVIRLKDILKGIPVKDTETNEYITLDGKTPEKSTAAGRVAVGQVAVSRVVMSTALVLFPTLTMYAIFNVKDPKKALNPAKRFFVQRQAALYQPVNVLSLTFFLLFALPFATATFPQDVVMDAAKLEPKFHGLKNKNGNEIKQVTFFKGL